VLTLLPLALGIGSGAEMQRPLAVAVIGGLLVSPFFTLLVAPTFLLLLDRWREQTSPASEHSAPTQPQPSA
jgi:Cu/Ag efflux pump CusA